MGDGFTDPVNQVQGYADYAYSAGIIDTQFRDYLIGIENTFVNRTKAGNFSGANYYLSMIEDFLTDIGTNEPWINIFNVRNNSDQRNILSSNCNSC